MINSLFTLPSSIKMGLSTRRFRLEDIHQSDWLTLLFIIIFATVLRLTFYTGFFGSDEVTYIDTARNIVAGHWGASDYIGATRYGMNLPVAFSIYLFGLTEASANAWTLLCSVGEVAVVFIIARRLWNPRAALIGAGILALLPIHVHFAGRMMADPPLAFFLTLSVALLLRSAHFGFGLTSLAAGLAWGGVFWVKESVGLLYAPVFLLICFYLYGLNNFRGWLLIGMGMALAVAANCFLMYLVADNPMYIFALMKKAVGDLWNSAFLSRSPWFYLHYLFIDIRHTFLLGPLVAVAFLLYSRFNRVDLKDRDGVMFVMVWIFLLLGMFSVAIVSFSPIKLVMKQTNYMLIFAAPMALLAGWGVASFHRYFLAVLLPLLVCGSITLAALEQQAVAVFTANSRAAYRYLADHPNAFLLGSANNARAVYFYSMLEQRPDISERMSSLGDIAGADADSKTTKLATHSAGKEVFALIDPQNIAWGNRRNTILSVRDVPRCWPAQGELVPAPLGVGRWVVQGLIAVGTALPAILQQRYLAALQPVAAPSPGLLFGVDLACVPVVKAGATRTQ